MTKTKKNIPVITKGYKVTDPNGKCRGFQYELNTEYKHDGAIGLCNSGFHFCMTANDCFNYYPFDSSNRMFEVEVYGDVKHGDDKSVCGHIKLIRELSWQEVLNIINTGKENTGRGNTGDWNTGDRNTVDRNTGDRNTGDRNTGYWNTGNWNTGDSNTGDSNTGNWNTGDRNTGYRNTGDRNTGYWNTGYRNTGDRNTGYWNTGNWNTGDRNTGNWNTGDRNTGNWNTGDRNTGYWNTGDRNTGYSNTGNWNTGAFCTGVDKILMFDKRSEWTIKDFEESDAFRLMRDNVNTKIWVSDYQMTDEEKSAYPSYKTAGGYLKDIPFKEAFQNAWHNFNDKSRNAFTSLPNFDAEIFFKITGVKIK